MIKTAVIGDREFCTGTVDKLVDVREFKIVGLHDPVVKEENPIAHKYNLKTYDGTCDLLRDVDAIIAMPPSSEHENVSYFVKNCKHVFFEPSKDYCKAKADKLSAIIDEADVKVQVGFHHRFKNTIVATKPFVVKPKFIQVGNYRKFDSAYSDIRVLLNMLVNDIDIVLSLVKSEVKNVMANATSIVSELPDVINTRIEFYNGCVAQIIAGLIATEDSHKLDIYCDKNYLNIDFHKNKAFLVNKKDKNSSLRLFQENVGDLNVEQIHIKPDNYLFDEFSSFAKSIVYDKTPEVSVESTLKTLSIVQTIKEKIKLSTL